MYVCNFVVYESEYTNNVYYGAHQSTQKHMQTAPLLNDRQTSGEEWNSKERDYDPASLTG